MRYFNDISLCFFLMIGTGGSAMAANVVWGLFDSRNWSGDSYAWNGSDYVPTGSAGGIRIWY